ncbi:MAG: hypothetical protein WDM85_11485 [Caulobacteraceae bacterium]
MTTALLTWASAIANCATSMRIEGGVGATQLRDHLERRARDLDMAPALQRRQIGQAGHDALPIKGDRRAHAARGDNGGRDVGDRMLVPIGAEGQIEMVCGR